MASERQLRKFRREFDSELNRRWQYIHPFGAEFFGIAPVVRETHREILTHCRRNVRLSGTINHQALEDLTWEWTRSFLVTSFPNGAEWWAENILLPDRAKELEEEPLKGLDEVEAGEDGDIVSSLQELADLKEKGLIDDEEFKSAKRKLLE